MFGMTSSTRNRGRLISRRRGGIIADVALRLVRSPPSKVAQTVNLVFLAVFLKAVGM